MLWLQPSYLLEYMRTRERAETTPPTIIPPPGVGTKPRTGTSGAFAPLAFLCAISQSVSGAKRSRRRTTFGRRGPRRTHSRGSLFRAHFSTPLSLCSLDLPCAPAPTAVVTALDSVCIASVRSVRRSGLLSHGTKVSRTMDPAEVYLHLFWRSLRHEHLDGERRQGATSGPRLCLHRRRRDWRALSLRFIPVGERFRSDEPTAAAAKCFSRALGTMQRACVCVCGALRTATAVPQSFNILDPVNKTSFFRTPENIVLAQNIS